MAALELLERRGVRVEFPEDQTCCGQAHLSSGGAREARSLARRFLEIFRGYDHVVSPSASCVATVKRHYRWLLGSSPELGELEGRTRELCDFLVNVLRVDHLGGRFPYRVGIHASCHALRGLRLGKVSERMMPARPDPARRLLASIPGIELAELGRPDECCGFGGGFCVEEEAVSSLMGLDRLEDHRQAGVEVIASTDVSCLLHLEGLARRQGLPLRALHVAELLASAARSQTSE